MVIKKPASEGDIRNAEHEINAIAKRVTQVDENGNSINTDSPLQVVLGGTVDDNNSTTTPLLTGQTFTGTATDILDYAAISILIHADVNSANDGLIVEYSPDAIDWHDGEAYTIPGGTTKYFTPPLQDRYFRVKYTNNGSDQTEFHIHTILRRTPIKWSSHNLNDNLNDDDDGELNVSVIKLRTAQNSYVSAAATNNGNFKTSIEEYDASLDSNPIPVKFGDSGSIDAFNRVRVAGTGQRLDVEFIYDKQDDYFDEVTNNGTVTHNSNSRDLTLSLADAVDGSYAWMRSYPVPYTPGNSQLIDMTGILDDAEIGGGTAEVFLRSNITGSVVEETITQSSWLSNTTGVDWTKSQIFSIDFQSLKVGRIRYYMVRDGMFQKVAEITNDNEKDYGYWQLPNLPVSYRLYNTATETIAEIMYGDDLNAVGFRYRIAANASATMRAICATVKSEGGQDLRDVSGLARSKDMGVTTKTVSTTLIPLISFRCKDTYQSLNNLIVAIPKNFTVQTEGSIRFVIMYNTTLTGASWVDVQTNGSMMEYDITASAVTLGTGHIVSSEYIAAGGVKGSAAAGGLLGKTVLWNRQDGQSGIITLAAVRTGASNANVLAGLDWEELR